jgi:hypothetical protein
MFRLFRALSDSYRDGGLDIACRQGFLIIKYNGLNPMVYALPL